MAATYVVPVAVGTTSLPQAVTNLTNVYACPSVLGGTILVETSPSPIGPWTAWGLGASASGASVRLPVNGYIRGTAAVSAANLVISDYAAASNALSAPGVLINCNAPCATQSSAVVQPLFSFRIPNNFLLPNFKIDIRGVANLSANANVKTLTVLTNGIGGTAVQSLVCTSFGSYVFAATVFGFDGQNIKGAPGAALAGGYGGVATTIATSTLARDYINNETEFVVAILKATAGDTAEIASLVVSLTM